MFYSFHIKVIPRHFEIFICRMIFALEFQFNTRKVMQKQKHAI